MTRPPPRVNGIEDLVEVGSGSFGVVYRGWQPGAGREVAVKVITVPTSAATARRLEGECSALGAVSGHPNVVVVHDVGTTNDGRPCIVMEYLHGGSLADRLRVLGPLPPAEVVDIGIKLSSALNAAHAAGVLHRDVKPENILVSRFGEPKLSDFGIATFPGAPAGNRSYVIGSFAHTAPEVLAGDQPSVASDLYSLASTLVALLTGQPPYGRPQGEDIAGFLRAVQSAPGPDVRSLGVPDGLCRVLEQALARNPKDRQRDAEEFERQLERSHLTSSSAGSTGLLNRRRTAAVAVAGALAVTAFTLFSTLAGNADDPPGTTPTTTVSVATRPSVPLPPVVATQRAEEVVFQDDFSTSGRWAVSDDARRRTAYAEGQFRVTAKSGSRAFGIGAPVASSLRGSTRVEVDASLLRGERAQYGVSCAVEPGMGWYTGFIASDGRWRLEQASFGSPGRSVADGVEDVVRFAAAGSASTHISLECRVYQSRVTLNLSINGQQIANVETDAAAMSGVASGPALFVDSDGQEAEVGFDNFVVTQL